MTRVSALPRTLRYGSKLAMLVALLAQEEGAMVEEMAAALEWARHTVRGTMIRALTKRFGPKITSNKVEGRGRAYQIEDAAEVDADAVDDAGE
jgi:hypothetical protein